MVTRQRIDRLLSIQEIKANPRNARTHSKAQIRQIAESIKAFGFGAPVLVDETAAEPSMSSPSAPVRSIPRAVAIRAKRIRL